MKYLYKRRQDGKIQRTYIELQEEFYRSVTCQGHIQEVESRLIDFVAIQSSKVTSQWTEAQPKNSGRANATTAEQQAEAEVASKYQRMIDNGYVDHPSKVDNPEIKKVAMLAKPFDVERVQKQIDKDLHVFVQPKFDGIRCIATITGLFSRSGKKIRGMQHIEQQLEPLFILHPELVLDGELYNHEFKDDFNSIVSAVKREKNFDSKKADKIQYHVYDVVSNGAEQQKFSDRYLPFDLHHGMEHVRLCYTQLCDCMSDITTAHEVFLEKGYEGTMVRYDEAYAVNKRGWCLQKLKEFKDEEFTILRFEEGRGKSKGIVSVVVVDVGGVEVHATMMGALSMRAELWAERDLYVGGQATVKYFNKTKDGSLRFPNCKSVFKGRRDV